MKKLIVGMMVVLGCLGGSDARAQGGTGATLKKTAGESNLKSDVEARLGLTVDQQLKLKALRDEFRTRQKPLQESLRAKQEALTLELDGDKPNRQAVEVLIKAISALQGQLLSNNADHVFRTREIITPEQYLKMKEWRAERKTQKNSGRQDGVSRNRREVKKQP